MSCVIFVSLLSLHVQWHVTFLHHGTLCYNSAADVGVFLSLMHCCCFFVLRLHQYFHSGVFFSLMHCRCFFVLRLHQYFHSGVFFSLMNCRCFFVLRLHQYFNSGAFFSLMHCCCFFRIAALWVLSASRHLFI